MAKREALQELQIRIAKRLEQTETQSAATASWLGVRLGQQKILLPLQHSGEIHAVEGIHSLPYTLPWFVGVATLRGQIYGVAELAAFLPHIAEQPASATANPKQRLVAINEAFGLNVMLRVDELEGLRSQEAFIRSEPAPHDAPAYYGNLFYDASNTAWQEINLQALVQTPQFLNINTHRDPAPEALPLLTGV